MAKRKSSKEIMEGRVVRGDSSTASSDQGYSSAASSSAGDRKPAAAAAAAGKKQRSGTSMAMGAAASKGPLPPIFPIFPQQSPVAAAGASAAAAVAITPEEQELQQFIRSHIVVCKQSGHYNRGEGTKLPLSQCKMRLAKLSGLDQEATEIEHVRRINQLKKKVPTNSVCDKHQDKVKTDNERKNPINNPINNPLNNPIHNAKTSAKLVATKRAASEAMDLEGGLEAHPTLTAQQLLAKRDELAAPGTLLHSLIHCLPLPGTDTPPAKAIPFNINLGLLRRYGGKGPDGEQLVDPKDCKEVEGFAFTTTRGGYRGKMTQAGRDSVLQPATYFKTKVIFVSRRRFNAGELERELLKMCIDDLDVPHLINQNRGGYKLGVDAEWQAVSITYLDLTVPGADELVIHVDGKRIGA